MIRDVTDFLVTCAKCNGQHASPYRHPHTLPSVCGLCAADNLGYAYQASYVFELPASTCHDCGVSSTEDKTVGPTGAPYDRDLCGECEVDRFTSRGWTRARQGPTVESLAHLSQSALDDLPTNARTLLTRDQLPDPHGRNPSTGPKACKCGKAAEYDRKGNRCAVGYGGDHADAVFCESCNWGRAYTKSGVNKTSFRKG